MNNFIKFFLYFFKLPKYLIQFFFFYKINTHQEKYVLKPMLFDVKTKEPFDPHYLYHAAWACRILASTKPEIHYDFSSDLRFVTMVSAFIKTVQYNLSIPTIKLSNLEFRSADLTNMSNIKSNSLKSVSCMHVIEHIGLGRYGENINPDGDKKAIKELIRILEPNGDLLFVTPVGKRKIFFNAHRVYSYDDIINYFKSFSLKEISFIGDNGFYTGLEMFPEIKQMNNSNYGCGCFWFKKL